MMMFGGPPVLPVAFAFLAFARSAMSTTGSLKPMRTI